MFRKTSFYVSVFMLVVAFAIAGCAASQQMTYAQPQDTEVFNAPFDKVWGAIVATIAEQGAPVQSIEKDSGILTTQFVSFASGFGADKQIGAIAQRPPAGGFLSVWNAGRYTISIFASRSDSMSTRVKLTPHIEGYESNVTKSWHVCPSNGSLEAKLFSSIRAKL